MTGLLSEIERRLCLFLKAAIVNYLKLAEEINQVTVLGVLCLKKGNRLGADLKQRATINPRSSMQGRRRRLLGVMNKGTDQTERPGKGTGNSASGFRWDRWVLREQMLSNCLTNDHWERNRDCPPWLHSNLLVRAQGGVCCSPKWGWNPEASEADLMG